MAWPKGRKRTTKPKDADLRAKLLITMRNREKIWATGTPDEMAMLRNGLTSEMNNIGQNLKPAVDLAPYTVATVRVDQIDTLQYFAPKDASPETGSGAEAAP